MNPRHHKDTLIAHAGNHPRDNHGIVNPPVYHASTVVFPTVAALEDSQRDPLESIHYGRFGTPTTLALEEAVAALEGGHRTVGFPSGLAALTGTLLALAGDGGHVLMPDCVYAPTRRFCGGMLARMGVATTYYDPLAGAAIRDLLRPDTRVVFVESPGSLTFEVQDVPAIAAAAHAVGAKVVMDTTWSAGYLFRPFDHGVDVSVQAATKFIVGHSDAMLGTATAADEDTWRRIKRTAVDLGTCAGPDDCYLGLRGLRTLAARMARHQDSGLRVARWLKTRPEVALVLHPALPDCPGHAIWERDFGGACGLFGVVLRRRSKAGVTAMLDGLELFAMGYSWGGYESLIIPTAPESIRTATRWPHEGSCLRLHVGLEDPDDLIADLEAGLARLAATPG